MSSVTGNPPADVEQQPPGPPQERDAAAPGRSCRHCGSALLPGQDWCLNCGAAAPGSLERPRWRSTGAIAAGVAVLALGAAAASYAALNQHSPARATVVKVALATPPATPPAAGATKTAPPATPGHPTLPIPLQKKKLPKIPLSAPSPKALKGSGAGGTTGSAKSGGGSTGTGSAGTGSSSGTGAGTETSEPQPIMLDTNAASTYNPYKLPASYFGDPTLLIDGDPATAWTAQVNLASAPAMAEGALLKLGAAQKVSALQLDTQTPGMTVQVYGTTATTPPESIIDPEWVALSKPFVVKKHGTRIKLRHSKTGFRYVLLWISKAPADQLGTAQAPGHVAVNELEVFPAA